VLHRQNEICLRLKTGAKALCAGAEHCRLLFAACLYPHWTVRRVALCRQITGNLRNLDVVRSQLDIYIYAQVLHQDALDQDPNIDFSAVLSLLHQSHAQQLSSYLLERSTTERCTTIYSTLLYLNAVPLCMPHYMSNAAFCANGRQVQHTGASTHTA